MNYEDLYQSLQPQEKTIKDNLASLQKLFKAISREVESGDLKSLARDLNSMAETASSVSSALEEMKSLTGGFDARAYFENGEFAGQMLDLCREKGVDVQGTFPVYEMFPYRVRLDAENQDLYLDRKKVQCARPRSFVDTVRAGQEKLNRAPFNALSFASELADAYDIAAMKKKRAAGTDLYLTDLYKLLAPMSRFRKDYDQQSYAFDLARLYISGIDETKNGRKFQFGPSRKGNKSIRILGRDGQERYLATICFYEQEVQS